MLNIEECTLPAAVNQNIFVLLNTSGITIAQFRVTGGDSGQMSFYDAAGNVHSSIFSTGSYFPKTRIGDTTNPGDELEVVGVSQFGDGGTTNYTAISTTGDITQVGTGRYLESAKYKLTAIGGIAIRLTNKTGGNTVAGQLVAPYSATAIDDAFKTAAASSDEVFGIVLDAGIADGSEAWVIISGIADVLTDAGGSARGDRMISSATAGSADVWNTGGAVATHFLEIGHCIETRTGAGLARCVLHFN